jgi:hypothetical protein
VAVKIMIDAQVMVDGVELDETTEAGATLLSVHNTPDFMLLPLELQGMLSSCLSIYIYIKDKNIVHRTHLILPLKSSNIVVTCHRLTLPCKLLCGTFMVCY